MPSNVDWKSILRRPFVRSKADYRRALTEFSRTLTLIVDFEQLTESLVGKIREIADIPRIVILLQDIETNRFTVAESRGFDREAAATIRFTPEDQLIRWLTINEEPLIIPKSPGVMSSLSAKEQELLTQTGTQLVFPLIVMNRVTGIVLLGEKRAGPNFSKGELELLTTLLSQSALAFENALLYKEQQQRLRKMYRADRLATIGQIAAGAAHEIRNPLTSIRSSIQYLKKDLQGSEKEDIAAGLLDEVDRINDIINGLLSFVKPTTAHIEVVDLSALLHQCLALIKTAARKQRVELCLDTPNSLAKVHADQAQLKQVFLNIMMNALQVMPNGGRLEISLQQTGTESSDATDPTALKYLLEFKDTGPGIPHEDLDLVFDPFFTTKKEGTGLGLSISYGIINRHGGQIEIENYADQDMSGARVLIRLPQRSSLESKHETANINRRRRG